MKQKERFFRNGILNENRLHMIKKIAEVVKQNKIKIFYLGSEQVIDVYEECTEIKNINEKLAKKSTVRDLIK